MRQRCLITRQYQQKHLQPHISRVDHHKQEISHADMQRPWAVRAHRCFTPEDDLTDDLKTFDCYCISHTSPTVYSISLRLECFWKCQTSLKPAFPHGWPVRTIIIGDTLAVGQNRMLSFLQRGLPRSKIYVTNAVERASCDNQTWCPKQ